LKNKKIKCKKHIPFYQPYEFETNVPEMFFCEKCNKELPTPEPDWDAIGKEVNL
tara:strand:+ start:225 stop:386 length:162 start_codon:yes stop_codon:yes gene_type:complete